jgi:hypothetical protein
MAFFVFGPADNGAPLENYAETSWDAADPGLVDENKKYFVYVSCIHCHGRELPGAKLQYLDTDHWLDRVASDDDFAAVGQSKYPVLYDAGKDPNTPQHDAAFEVVRQLNQEILEQNQLADEAAKKAQVPEDQIAVFQTRAAANWLFTLHKNSSQHVPPEKRGILGTDGKTVWNPNDKKEVELIRMLNRFCFRCHSSVKYHVFDKKAVVANAGVFRYHLVDAMEWPERMPQDRLPIDRNLTNAKRERMIELVNEIADRPTSP